MGRTKPKCFSRYLVEKSRTVWNLNRVKNDVILSPFLTGTKHFGRNGTKQITLIHNTQVYKGNMGDEECVHRDAHIQEELDSLKASMARFASLLELTLRDASGEGPSTSSVAAARTQAMNHP